MTPRWLETPKWLAETEEERKERVRSYVCAAERGDRIGSAALGWEFVRGKRGPADLARALRQFEILKQTERDFALFQIAKVKYIFGDSSYTGDLEEAVAAGYVPALYLKAAIGWKNGEREEPISLWLRAAKAGHLPSTISWLGKNRGTILSRIWGLPLLIVTAARAALIEVRNPYDERVMR